MYEEYWNLRRKPFEIGADPEFYYPARGHQAVFLKLRYLLESRRGSGLLLGESGIGKSLLVTLLGGLRKEGSFLGPFIEVNMPRFSSEDILFYLAEKLLALPTPPTKIPGLVSTSIGFDEQPPVYKAFSTVERALERLANEGQKPVFVIEGADRVADSDVWSVLASLVELENKGTPLVSLLLNAVPEKLQRPIPFVEDYLEVVTELYPLDESETAEYILHRLNTVGAGQRKIFTDSGLAEIYRLTGGNPRKINRLGNMALLVGYAEQLSNIDDKVIISLNNELMSS